MHEKYKRLLWVMGLGELAVSFTTVIDMIAVSTIDITHIAGYSLASKFISAMYITYSTINIFAYVEYNKDRNIRVISILTKLALLTQLLVTVILILGMMLALNFSGLTYEANKIALLVLVLRCIGGIAFNCTIAYYVYLRSEGYEKLATKSRVINAVLNISFDLIAVYLKLGIVGIVGATILAEFLEYIRVKLFVLHTGVKLEKVSIKETVRYIKVMAESGLLYSIEYIQYIIINLIASRLGDMQYAVWGIVDMIVSQLSWFTDVNVQITEMLAAEYSWLCNKLRGLFSVALKETALYSCVIAVYTPLVIKLITYINRMNISVIELTLLCVYWAFIEAIFSILNGFIYTFEQYRYKAGCEIVATIGMSMAITFLLKIENIYVIYMLTWSIGYIIQMLLEYRKIKILRKS